MRNLVSHYRGQLAFCFRGQNEPGIHANISAGASKSVNIIFHYDKKMEWIARGIAICSQSLADRFYVVLKLGVLADADLVMQASEKSCPQFLFLFGCNQCAGRIPHIG